PPPHSIEASTAEAHVRQTMTLSYAAKVWNRAATERGGAYPRLGDQALAAMLALHSRALNGGPHHAVEVLTESERAAAIAGFAYFGLPRVVDFLVEISDGALAEWTDEHEAEAVHRYGMLASDELINARFVAVLNDSPDAF